MQDYSYSLFKEPFAFHFPLQMLGRLSKLDGPDGAYLEFFQSPPIAQTSNYLIYIRTFVTDSTFAPPAIFAFKLSQFSNYKDLKSILFSFVFFRSAILPHRAACSSPSFIDGIMGKFLECGYIEALSNRLELVGWNLVSSRPLLTHLISSFLLTVFIFPARIVLSHQTCFPFALSSSINKAEPDPSPDSSSSSLFR